MKKLRQLALNLCLNDHANFTNFFTGDNRELVAALSNLSANDVSPFVYIWGKSGVGKSHLLGAVSQMFGEQNLSCAYLPLEDIQNLNVAMLDDLDNLDLLCIDDIHLLDGNLDWEEGIFHCFNQMVGGGKKVLVSADVAPQFLTLKLPDLRSRMASGLIFAVQKLSDEDKICALQLRAKSRGLELNDVTARFLLSHYSRDIKSLFGTLEKLDQEALLAQRKLTVPFVKSVLG